MQLLARSFYERPVVEVAPDLLGKLLARRNREGLTSGMIVEVEAYLSRGDSACHAARGQTASNRSMFGPPGRAYVYSIHARYCFNVVTEPVGTASAVLVRALQPIDGLALMQCRRGTPNLRALNRGPGRLCQAMAIDRRLDGIDLTRPGRIWIAADPRQPTAAPILCTPRIGVTSACDLPLRFVIAGNRYICRPQLKPAEPWQPASHRRTRSCH